MLRAFDGYHGTHMEQQDPDDKAKSGRYNSASEVVREALRLMEQKDEIRTIQLQGLRERMDKGLAQAERGEGVDGEVHMQGLIDDLDSRQSKRKAG